MKITNIELKTASTGNQYKAVTLDDGKKFNVFNNNSRYEEVAEGLEVAETDLEKDGKWWNFKDPQGTATKGGFKTTQIKEAQARKETSISKAQDRSELMWAKRSAMEIITHHPMYREINNEEDMERAFEKLVSFILNTQSGKDGNLQPF